MVYAGAQKNLGPSGIVLVIVRKDLVDRGKSELPTMLQYRTHSENESMFNTPNTFGIYMMGQTFAWILEQGGLEEIERTNRAKAGVIYDYLDSSSFFNGTARKDSRSLMNVCFRALSEELEARFITEASSAGLSGLKGHRSVGGMRASIYNAVSLEGCERLVEFMKRFEAANQ
jgi:phosphoserine aminotransferase